MKELQIVIQGTTGAGKSSLAYLIQKTLGDNNITSTIVETPDDGDSKAVADSYIQRVKSLNGINVLIQTQQITRMTDKETIDATTEQVRHMASGDMRDYRR